MARLNAGFKKGQTGERRKKEIPMKAHPFSELRVAAIFDQAASGFPVPMPCREHGISNSTICN